MILIYKKALTNVTDNDILTAGITTVIRSVMIAIKIVSNAATGLFWIPVYF